jgi:hypothetical protein
MDNKENKDVIFETIEVIENVAIIFKDGDKKFFDAVQITNRGVSTGFIKNVHKLKINIIDNLNVKIKEKKRNSYDTEFIENGFIPKKNIANLKNGNIKKILKRTIRIPNEKLLSVTT